jgi:uncharacterized protein YcnI
MAVQHYYTIYQDGQGASASDADVKAGTGTGAVTSASDLSVTSGVAKEFTATGLAPSTEYDLEYVVSDGTSDTRASTTNFRTKAQTGSVVINTPGPIVRN